ncbi:hypothetical protein MKK75_14035 [Methylobacterium sp. J-030]|uniref:hypothetical protein n=1 Tax=Methylobacterium sp. J-030 TaxID=2836627 RepID=UPI001FB9C6DE|nr:hypothetical protein [Methylobacterium sp. J-030]MCJ2069900.1 hypothetical protein [Methylobacterium sp. J-030]
MRRLTRTALLAGLVAGAAGSAYAAEGKDTGRKDKTPTTSMGAGGLTGTGATQDGARTGTDKPQTGGTKPPSAPAAGTTR